ncbi:MAG: autotransporter domain-containing protein [Planctomycetaceae bacterium]|nr:autotransporter domain-containing protein [Planctomycetaceae bacterium]
MQRKFVKYTVRQAVIQFSILIFCLLTLTNYSYGQPPIRPETPISPLPPYNDPLLDSVVIIKIEENWVGYNNSILTTPATLPIAGWDNNNNNILRSLIVRPFEYTTTAGYVFGLMTNNGGVSITGSNGAIKIINNQLDGHAAGIIYQSTNRFTSNINFNSTSLDVISGGNAVGVSFPANTDIATYLMSGSLTLDSLNVKSTNAGSATGINVGRMTTYFNGDHYPVVSINVNDEVTVTATSGEAVGVSINEMIGATLDLAAIAMSNNITVESTVTGNATGIKVGTMGYIVTNTNSARHASITASDVVVTANSGNATGISVKNTNNVGDDYSVSNYITYDTIDVKSTSSGNATGIFVDSLGNKTSIYESYTDYSYFATYGISAVAESGSATGVHVNKVGYGTRISFYADSEYYPSPSDIYVESKTSGNATGIFIDSVADGNYYYDTGITYDHVGARIGTSSGSSSNGVNIDALSVSGFAKGIQINDLGNEAIVTFDTITATSTSGSATGVEFGDIGERVRINIDEISATSTTNTAIALHITGIIEGNTSTYYAEPNYYNTAISASASDLGSVPSQGIIIMAESDSGQAIGVLLENTIRERASLILDEIDVVSNTGSAIGMRVNNVSGNITVADIFAETASTDVGVFGFVIDGTIAAHTTISSSSASGGGVIEIENIEVTTSGGKGNAAGLVSSGMTPIGGTLAVEDITVTANGTSTGSAIGIDFVNGVKMNGSPTEIQYPTLQLGGTISATAISSDAYGIRIGSRASVEGLIVVNEILAESDEGNAVGILSYNGGNAITIDTTNSMFGDYVLINGHSNDGFSASIYLSGKNNTLTIGSTSNSNGEIFTNADEDFLVYGAQNITFNVETEFSENVAFVGSRDITINKDIFLDPDRGGWFDPLTEKVTIASGVEADFGASAFNNVGIVTTVTFLTPEGKITGVKEVVVDSEYKALSLPGILEIKSGEVPVEQVEDGNVVIYVYKDAADQSAGKVDRKILIANNAVVTKGLELVTDGRGIFNRDQVFEGIKGSNSGLVIIDGNAELIGPGNFNYGGGLIADSVTVNKKNSNPTTLGSTQIGTHVPIGTQEISFLETGLLTVNSGTLKITNTANVSGLEGGSGGNLTGTKGATIVIDTDGNDHVFGGFLQMGYITKKGAGKQTVGRIETSNVLTIDNGEFAITGSALISGVVNDVNAGAGKTLTVGGNLTLDIGIDEIIKVASPTDKTNTYQYIQRDHTFVGDLVAGSVTKKGKGIQRFDTITSTGAITFSAGDSALDGKYELDASNFSSTDGILINIGTLIGTKDLRVGGELVANSWAVMGGIEGEEGKLSGGDFTINANENHSSKVDVEAASLTKNGQGKQSINSLKTKNLFHNAGIIQAVKDIEIENGIDGNSGQVNGQNITINGKDNKDHYFAGDVSGYNLTKRGAGVQTFNKLETVNNFDLAEGQAQVNQIIVNGTLSLGKDTTLELNVKEPSWISATGDLDGTILVHGQARANTVGIRFGGGVDRNKFRIAFVEEPDQFITWRLGENSVFAEANSQAYMSESYLSSLLLHDHHSAWNSVVKRLNQSLPASAPLSRDNDYQSRYRFLGQSPFLQNANKSLWVNYIGRTGQHKSTFYDQKFKLRADGIQVGYDIIPSQTLQYGLVFGYEGQSSAIVRDKVDADDTYIGIYGAKILSSGIDLRAIVNYGHQAYTSTRYAKKASGYNKAKFNGDTIEGILEVGRRYELGRRFMWRPTFAVELYYNMINHAKEDDYFHTDAAVTYDLATLKQTLLRFGNDWSYEIRRLVLSGGFYYTFNCGTDKLSTIVVDDFGQRLPLRGSKLGRSILSADFGGQFYTNELQTRSIFASYSGSIYPDRKGTPITGTFSIGFQFDY